MNDGSDGGEVSHYGELGTLTVAKCAYRCYCEWGHAKAATASQGLIVAKKGGSIDSLAATVKDGKVYVAAKEDGGTIGAVSCEDEDAFNDEATQYESDYDDTGAIRIGGEDEGEGAALTLTYAMIDDLIGEVVEEGDEDLRDYVSSLSVLEYTNESLNEFVDGKSNVSYYWDYDEEEGAWDSGDDAPSGKAFAVIAGEADEENGGGLDMAFFSEEKIKGANAEEGYWDDPDDPGCGLFSEFEYASEIDVSNLDTSSMDTFNAMFMDDGCCLDELPDDEPALVIEGLDGFETSNVEDMGCMFQRCCYLEDANVSNFDTSSVTDMSYMFQWCCYLEDADVSNFDTSSVTDMSYMFQYCSSLESIAFCYGEGESKTWWDTSKVTNFSCMFYMEIDEDDGLEANDALTEIDMSGMDLSNATNTNSMFKNCAGLETIHLPNTLTVVGSYAFNGCVGLQSIELPDSVTSIGDYAFSECTNLTSISLPKNDEVSFTSSIIFSDVSITSISESVSSLSKNGNLFSTYANFGRAFLSLSLINDSFKSDYNAAEDKTGKSGSMINMGTFYLAIADRDNPTTYYQVDVDNETSSFSLSKLGSSGSNTLVINEESYTIEDNKFTVGETTYGIGAAIMNASIKNYGSGDKPGYVFMPESTYKSYPGHKEGSIFSYKTTSWGGTDVDQSTNN